MEALFNQATRTAELLQKRSPNGQLEMLDTALDEGYATMEVDVGMRTLNWHGFTTIGGNDLQAISNWITAVERQNGEAA